MRLVALHLRLYFTVHIALFLKHVLHRTATKPSEWSYVVHHLLTKCLVPRAKRPVLNDYIVCILSFYPHQKLAMPALTAAVMRTPTWSALGYGDASRSAVTHYVCLVYPFLLSGGLGRFIFSKSGMHASVGPLLSHDCLLP